MRDITPEEWFGVRRLDFCPCHFVRTKIPLTVENTQWISENLTGRYAFYYNIQGRVIDSTAKYAAFENPEEALFFELHWS